MEIKCQGCGEYYKDLLAECPSCFPQTAAQEESKAKYGAPVKKPTSKIARYFKIFIRFLAISFEDSRDKSRAIICPHCQTRGEVSVKQVKRKQGISGAKATGALLTMGISMLATGLSRKETMTQAHCENCNSTWHF